MSKEERSRLFTAYNGARRLVRTGRLDAGRVNRALGLAQRREAEPDDYASSPEHCACPDRTFRQVTCKHMLAQAMKQLAVLS